jgi:hypothetical protein
VWVRHDAHRIACHGIEFVLDEYSELAVDRHARQVGVARLLQPLDQQWPIRLRAEDVGIEVVPLDAFGIGQDDSTHAKGGELSPEPPHHLRSGQGQQEIDPRPWGNVLERAGQSHRLGGGVDDRGDADRTVDLPDANRLARDDAQHVEHVRGARIREGERR